MGGTLINSADELFKIGKFEEALKNYKQLLKSTLHEAKIPINLKIVECLCKTRQYTQANDELAKLKHPPIFRKKPILYAKFLILCVDVSISLGNYEKARFSGEKAFEILRSTDKNELIAKVQRLLGIVYVSQGDLDKARIWFEDLLSTCRRAGDEEGFLFPLNRLAQVCLLTARWSQAIEYLEQGLEVSKKTKSEEWTAAFSLNLGALYWRIGDWRCSSRYLSDGLKIWHSLRDALEVLRGELSLAFLYRVRREWEKSSRLLEKCRKLCKKQGYKRELCLSYEGLGELTFDQANYAKAETYYKKAYEIAREIAPKGDLSLEISRRLADLYVTLDRPKDSLKHGAAALRIAKKLGDKFEEACTHRARALAYQKLGESAKTHQLFTQAIQLLEELGEKYERARTLLEFSKFLSAVEKEDEAITYLLKAKELFGKLPSKYWMGMSELEIAGIRFNKGGTDLAVISLNEATSLFSESSEAKALTKCSRLRGLIEKAMVKISLKTSHHTIPDDNPENLLKFLVRRTSASRAFVILFEDGDFEIKALHNMETNSAKRVLEVLSGPKLENPVISTNPLDKSLSLVESDGIRSFILIPFGAGGGRGILYLDKKNPFTQKDLTFSVRFADSLALKIAEIRQEELKAENLKLRKELEKRGYPEIVTRDKRMIEILNLVDKVKNYSTPVLIEGETGTGKELIARAIHYKGLRATKPFIALDCGALPESLAESELFGHKKGSFTDAKEDKPGLFEFANGGTLFLDEVSNLSLRTQAKLLRVLQEERVRRIGDTKERKVNVRIIAASNRSLEEEISKGRFREDLYHRLKVMEINLPPLRERKDDIPILVQYFIENYSVQRKKQVEGITAQALNMLRRYKWPGNVRQLKNEIERAIILTESTWITPTLFSVATKKTKPKSGKKSYNIEEIIRALKQNNWIKRKAARALGIPESTLRSRLKIHDIEIPTKF